MWAAQSMWFGEAMWAFARSCYDAVDGACERRALCERLVRPVPRGPSPRARLLSHGTYMWFVHGDAARRCGAGTARRCAGDVLGDTRRRYGVDVEDLASELKSEKDGRAADNHLLALEAAELEAALAKAEGSLSAEREQSRAALDLLKVQHKNELIKVNERRDAMQRKCDAVLEQREYQSRALNSRIDELKRKIAVLKNNGSRKGRRDLYWMSMKASASDTALVLESLKKSPHYSARRTDNSTAAAHTLPQ